MNFRVASCADAFRRTMRLASSLFLGLLAGCVASNQLLTNQSTADSQSGDSITRTEVMKIADAYVKHEWRATSANVFHGFDTNGVRIDTPDVKWWGDGGWYSDGRANVGVAYCWGGESSPAEFDEGLQAGRPAGYVSKVSDPQIRLPISALPVGVDCSGFVSRCWRLKVRRSTTDLIDECRQLSGFAELRPGDAINRPNHHVMLFKKWLDRSHTTMRVVEAYGPNVHESEHTIGWLVENGYVPLRYQGIVER